MKARIICLFLPLALGSGCGRNLEKQVRESVRTFDIAELPEGSVEVLEVKESGKFAIAEVRVTLPLKLENRDGRWVIEEIRIGDRRWEKADHVRRALDQERRQDTQQQLTEIRAGIERYRAANGALPEAADFEDLIDILTPGYLAQVIRIDGWANPFSYRTLSAGKYDLRSSGADGLVDTPDDVTVQE